MAPSKRELQTIRNKRKQLLEESRQYEERVNQEVKNSTNTIRNLQRNFTTIQQNIQHMDKKINETKQINERNENLLKSRLVDQFNRAKQEQEQLSIRQEKASREVK